MTTSKNYGPRHKIIGQVGITSYGQHLYWDTEVFEQSLSKARDRGFTHDTVVLRQHLFDARKAMDAAERETFIVDYLDNGPIVTDSAGRVFTTEVTVAGRPESALSREARNYLVQEILDALKADQELTFAWVTVRTPKRTPKPVVEVADGQYKVTLPGGVAFAVDVNMEHLLPQIHDAIEAHKASEADIETRAADLHRQNCAEYAPWNQLSPRTREAWLYAARLGGR